jgi:hypothetical protein
VATQEELAFSMRKLHGPQAHGFAALYAEEHLRAGNTEKYLLWSKVREQILQWNSLPPSGRVRDVAKTLIRDTGNGTQQTISEEKPELATRPLLG